MKTIITTVLAFAAVSATEASAFELKGLHQAVKVKVDKYCPETIAREDIDTLRKDEILRIKDVDYFAEGKTKIPELDAENVVLCSGTFAQNRSAPARVGCSFCTEEGSTKPVFTLSAQITREVDDLIAKREEEEKLGEKIEPSEASPEETYQESQTEANLATNRV
jgi:hypothetical protein